MAKIMRVGREVANPNKKKQDKAPPNAERRIVFRSETLSLSMPMNSLPKIEEAVRANDDVACQMGQTTRLQMTSLPFMTVTSADPTVFDKPKSTAYEGI